MFTEQKRYPGVEGKTVAYVETRNEGDTLFFHIHFTDKTFLGISVAPNVRLHSADLYAESSGDYEVLKDYVHGTRIGKEGKEMILLKDPPGYPGDEFVRKAFGRVVKRARLECGLTINQAEALLREALAPAETGDKFEHVGRAFGIVVRRIREAKGMTRIQLAQNSGLPLRFIILVERGKVATGGDICQLVRLSFGLRYPVDRFLNELTDLNEKFMVDAR